MEEEFTNPFWDDYVSSLGTTAKKLLLEIFGEKMTELEPESYLEIESVIKDGLWMCIQDIPDILYRGRTIKDEEEWEKAYDNFVHPATPYDWKENEDEEKWYMRDYKDEDDDDDFFIDEDASEDHKKAAAIIKAADELINGHIQFTNYMKAFCLPMIAETKTYIFNTSSFDLSILNDEGWKNLRRHIDMFIETLAEDLLEVINGGQTA